jgi:peptide/nickel transport system substrate-binding protein
LDGYTVRIVKDNTVALQMFKTQDIDIVSPDPIDWEEVKKLPFAATYEYFPASPAWTYIGFNTVNPLLSDKRVRQAISHAINKQEFVDKIRRGYAKVQHSNIPATSWAFTDDVAKFNYDVNKAKALLKDAGWTPGSDGILVKDGKKFEIRLFYNAGNTQREQISIISQDYLKAVGIKAEVIPEEWTAYLKRVQEPDPKKRDFEMFVLGWSGGIDPFGTGNIWKSKGSQNYTGFNNADVDKLYDDAAAVPGCKQEDRKKLYAKIQQIIAEEQPYLFLYTNQSLVAVNKRIKANPVTILGISYQLELWQLSK